MSSLFSWIASLFDRGIEPSPPKERRGYGFNPTEVANLRSWGYNPRPEECIPVFEAPKPQKALEWFNQRPRSEAERAADERRRQADFERQMGLRPR